MAIDDVGFVHLHVHSSYSLLEGALPIAKLAKLARADKKIGSSLEAAPVIYISDPALLAALAPRDLGASLFAGGCNNATYASNPSCVPLGTFGDAARDIFHGPGTIQWDMSASRIFQFSERIKLQYKSEFFNIMNHANFNVPSLGDGNTNMLNGDGTLNGTAGLLTQTTTDPREIQFALKLIW